MENEQGMDELTEEAGCGDGDKKVGFNGITEATRNSSSTSLPSTKRNADKPYLQDLATKAHVQVCPP